MRDCTKKVISGKPQPRQAPGMGLMVLALIATLVTSSGVFAAAPSEWDMRARLDQWRVTCGESWRVNINKQTGYADFIYGGSAAPQFRASRESEYFQLARSFLERTRALHGIETFTLEEDRLVVIRMSDLGSSDKRTVRFKQVLVGMPVIGGSVNVLLDIDDNLLSIESVGLPDIGRFSGQASINEAQALKAAIDAFRATTGQEPNDTLVTGLAVSQVNAQADRTATLVWWVGLAWFADRPYPQASFTYWVDAETGAIVHESSNIMATQLRTWATPGTKAASSSNPPDLFNMGYAKLTWDGGSAVTEADGAFSPTGITVPISVGYYGRFNRQPHPPNAYYTDVTIYNSTMFNRTFTGTPSTWDINSPPQDDVTAEANCYLGIVGMLGWIRDVNEANFDNTDYTAEGDFEYDAYVNQTGYTYPWWLNDGETVNITCNAMYVSYHDPWFGSIGPEMTFGVGDPLSCANASFSTVVAHEMGHWLNDRYNTGNSHDGMGEGAADIWAMYRYDTPLVGEEFNFSGYIRSGENTRQFCGDCCHGCYGEEHSDGEPLMGAAWKVRKNLKDALGDYWGIRVADALFIGWMNVYDQTTIHSVILNQWLTLDDDDGNLGNGTPHYSEIVSGFRANGFDVTFLNQSWTGSESGAYMQPYNTLSEALSNTDNDGVIRVLGGAEFNETITLSNPLTLEAW